MINHDAVHLALRAWALGVIGPSTGNTVLASTATGFTRTDGGSFVSDGLAIGMEIMSSGFVAANVNGIVTSVAPTDLRVSPFTLNVVNGVQSVSRFPLPVEVGAGPRRIDAVLPSMRAWENQAPTGLSTFVTVNGIPYIGDEYSPSTSTIITQSLMESRGDYILRWHGVPNTGTSGMRRMIDALKVRFAPGTVLDDGYNGVRVAFDAAPESSAIVETTSGPIITLIIPWIVRSPITIPVL